MSGVSPLRPEDPRRLGTYRLDGRLGVGGQGIVFVDGPSLRDHVAAAGPRTGGDLDRVAVGTATALAAIHRAGVVHRDFKPGNVLLGSDGLRVVDFGVSRLADATVTTGNPMGTPAYIAPEQLEGRPAGTPAASAGRGRVRRGFPRPAASSPSRFAWPNRRGCGGAPTCTAPAA
ncbi:protein kinase [Microbispora amethystogenes]|uniref:protein kinase domain-containing protein n=1 Tax=Microbispora amethystogenes TaxID=1427754 RepID=UPI0034073DF9